VLAELGELVLLLAQGRWRRRRGLEAQGLLDVQEGLLGRRRTRRLAAAAAGATLGEQLLALVVEDEDIVVMQTLDVDIGLAVTTFLLVAVLL